MVFSLKVLRNILVVLTLTLARLMIYFKEIRLIWIPLLRKLNWRLEEYKKSSKCSWINISEPWRYSYHQVVQ